MNEKENKDSASAKLSAFLEKNRVAVLVLCVVLVVAIVAFAVCDSLISKQTKKTVALVDEISYAMTNGSAVLGDDELDTRRATAKKSLEPLLKKGGTGGVRANMLAAEIAFDEKDYASAIEYWNAVYSKGKKSYTAPLALYNLAVCYEMTGKNAEAAQSYKKASDYADFLMKAHAKFNYGRVLETMGNFSEAATVYQALFDELPDDPWANTAKSRLMDMKISGKIE